MTQENDTALFHNESIFYFHTWEEIALFGLHASKHRIVIGFVVVFICLLGMMGNATVLWFLCFRIKRNPFTVYIMNLAVADFGVLLALCCDLTFARLICLLPQFYFLVPYFFLQSASISFLTVISIHRCLLVLFPIWCRCHRPRNLSAFVSACVWTVSSLLLVVLCSISMFLYVDISSIISLLGFAPLMIISTLILLIKICCHSQLRKQGRLHVAILLALLFFIITMVILATSFVVIMWSETFALFLLVFISLNSSINPVIYFLIGRYRSGQSRTSLKVALQRVFKEEEENDEERQNSPN